MYVRMSRIRSCPLYSFALGLFSVLPVLLAPSPARAATVSGQVVVDIGQNFTASTLNVDSSAVPPDSDGAAGPLHYVEMINGRFSVFDKSNGNKVKTTTDLVF